MRLFPTVTAKFQSHLSPDELSNYLANSILPAANESWRDSFAANPSQPFQGVVGTASFSILRLSIGQVRRTAPLRITGHIRPAEAGLPGSLVVVQLSTPPLAAFVISFAWLLALCLAVAVVARVEIGRASWGGLLYFIVPVGFTFYWQAQLQTEATIAWPLLQTLLKPG